MTHADFDRSFRFTGRQVASLMRRHKVTIRELAARMQISMKRIRQVREHGIAGHSACDWYQGITGSLSPRMAAAYRFCHTH